MQKVYMLTEEEYSMLQGMSLRIEQLEKENASLMAHAKQSIKERYERIEALRKENDALSRKLRDAQALLGLIPEDALTIAKLTQLASMGK